MAFPFGLVMLRPDCGNALYSAARTALKMLSQVDAARREARAWGGCIRTQS